MRITTRIHEWLADRVEWVQYPQLREVPRGLSLRRQYLNLTRKQKAWVWFFVFWGAIAALAYY